MSCSDFSIFDSTTLEMILERRQIVATENNLTLKEVETNYCCRVAAKILKVLEGFRAWRMARGESDWVKASVSWMCEKLVSEYPDKMVRRGFNLLERLGIVDRILSSDAKIPGKSRWKNPAMTWFYQIKIDLNNWVKSTQAPGSIMPKQYHIDPKSPENLTTVVKDLEIFPIKEGIDQKIISLKNKLAERVEEKTNYQDELDYGEDLTFDQIMELETQREAELSQIEDLEVVLHPKLLRLILAVPLLRLQEALAAMKQQDRNKRDKGERIKDPAGFLQLAIVREFKPNKKAENLFNNSGKSYEPPEKSTCLDSLWAMYHNKDDFLESALYYGHSESSIKVFLTHK